MSKNAYLRMIEAAEIASRKTALAGLDYMARHVLDFIAVEQEKRAVRVGDIQRHYSDSATNPTIYARLEALELEGLIQHRVDPNDGRARLVSLTAKAKNAYGKVALAVDAAMDRADA